MSRPYIYFCGDESKILNFTGNRRNNIKSAFITKANADRLLDTSTHYSTVIFMVFKKGVNTSDKFYKKIYRYAETTRCPLCIIGSANQFKTVKRLASGTVVQRVTVSGMVKIVKSISKLFAENPHNDFALYKARFQTVAIASSNVSSAALIMNRTETSDIKPRIITITGTCENEELELLKENNLSEIISDKGVSENLLKITADKKETPVILINNQDKIPRGLNARSIALKDENGEIIQLLSDYQKKQSRHLYRANAKKNTDIDS